MNRITIFTPSYNREYCLHYLYESLCRQNCQDFIWLIIDDGSTDNTKELVDQWIVEDKIKIQYIYKKNGGMHTAHNVAYDNITTELNICIDSDDRLAKNAIKNILSCWESVNDKQDVIGLVGLDADLNNKVIGTLLPEDIDTIKFHQIYQKYGVKGDKKVVLRTSLINKDLRYPIYEGERLVPLSYLYYELDKKYNYICFNQVWANIDYQLDGSSATIDKQYFSSPRGFRFAKINEYNQSTVFLYKIKALIHYGFTSLIIGDYSFFKKSPNPILSLMLYPFSVFFYYKKKLKVKKGL